MTSRSKTTKQMKLAGRKSGKVSPQTLKKLIGKTFVRSPKRSDVGNEYKILGISGSNPETSMVKFKMEFGAIGYMVLGYFLGRVANEELVEKEKTKKAKKNKIRSV